MLAKAILCGRWRVLGVAELLHRLKRAAVSLESLAEVFRLVSPIWVESEIAGRFGTLSRAAEGAPFVGVVACKHLRYSSRMLAWRSQLPDTDDFVFWLVGGDSDTRQDETIDQIRRICRERYDTIESDEDVDDFLADPTNPMVFVLPPPVPDDGLLRALRDTFKGALFLAHAGPTAPGEGTLPDAAVLLPLGLPEGEETARHNDYLKAQKVL